MAVKNVGGAADRERLPHDHDGKAHETLSAVRIRSLGTGLVLMAGLTVTSCGSSRPATAESICMKALDNDAGLGGQLLSAKATTAANAATEMDHAGVGDYPWRELAPSHLVAYCTYQVLGANQPTSSFEDSSGRSTLAPPSVSATPPGPRHGPSTTTTSGA